MAITMGTDTFGQTGVGPTTGTYAQISGGMGTAKKNGIVDSISYYVKAASGTVNLKCALYVWVANVNAGALIAGTEQISIDTTTKWNTCNFLAPKPPVYAGTKYFICGWTSGSATFYAYTTGGVGQWYRILAYDGWPDPMTSEGAADTYDYSIFATYTEMRKYKAWQVWWEENRLAQAVKRESRFPKWIPRERLPKWVPRKIDSPLFAPLTV